MKILEGTIRKDMSQVESSTPSIVPATRQCQSQTWLTCLVVTRVWRPWHSLLLYQPHLALLALLTHTGHHLLLSYCSPPASRPPNFARCSPGPHPCHQPSAFTQPFLDQVYMKGGTICPYCHVAWQFTKMGQNGDMENKLAIEIDCSFSLSTVWLQEYELLPKVCTICGLV